VEHVVALNSNVFLKVEMKYFREITQWMAGIEMLAVVVENK
jgi:hypothetical protein